MSIVRRVAVLALATITPLVANAQAAQQPKPAPQTAPQAPAANQGNAAATPASTPAAPSNSRRFVTSDNFYRPGTKPSPATSTPPTPTQPAATPVTQPAAVVRPNVTVAPRAIAPQPIPVSTPAPEVHSPQPAVVVPAVIATPSLASGAPANAAVDYASGQLSVVADNAPLGFVLKLIAAKTGAVIDLAPELQNEPVVAHVGPSPVRDVLTALLDSPKIDYVVLGGSDESDRLQRVVVRMRHSMGLFAMSGRRQPQPRPEISDEEEKLDQNGHLVSNPPAAGDPQFSAKDRMENWQKAREAMRVAEVKQQEQDRENDKNGSPDPPAPPQNNQPPDPPQNPQQENPPSR